MSEVYEFIKKCGHFFVLTDNHGIPAGRPFGAIMEDDNHLYIATSNEKDVYRQIKNNPNVQIISFLRGTRNWVRVTGIARERIDLDTKKKMLLQCPVLQKHYPSADYEHYNVFEIAVTNIEMR